MKYILIIILLVAIIFIYKRQTKLAFEKGFEVGSWEQVIYSDCHKDYMSLGFREYMWHKQVPQTCYEIDSAEAIYLSAVYKARGLILNQQP